MGAFDGIRIPYDKGYPTGGFKNEYEYFDNQSAFSFFKGFGELELAELLFDAELNNDDMVWVPRERLGDGKIGLKTWYVKALLVEHSRTAQ